MAILAVSTPAAPPTPPSEHAVEAADISTHERATQSKLINALTDLDADVVADNLHRLSRD